jgi:DNA-binding IclR family transcriptional regulator
MRTVERTCAVLSAFSPADPHLSLRELSERVALPKATVHRLAGALVATGFMEHHDDGSYCLGPKLSELGALARADLDIVTACSPALDALAAATGESVLLAEADWDALEMSVVSVRVSPQTLSVVPIAGTRAAIPAGCLGKAMLLGLPEREAESVLGRLPLPALTRKTHTDRAQLAAELAEARATGYVIADEEYLDGVSGAGVPVVFEDGRPRAAISVVGPTPRVAGQLERLGNLMLELTVSLRPGARAPQEVA